MKDRRIYTAFMIIVLTAVLMAGGCGKKSAQSDYYYYHIDDTGMALEKDTVDLEAILNTAEASGDTVETDTAETGAAGASGDLSADASGNGTAVSSGDGSAAGNDEEEEETIQTESLVEAMVSVLNEADPDSLFPDGVRITNASLSGMILTLDFTAEYASMDDIRELLCRAAVVETMLQFDDITAVTFCVDTEPLLDDDGSEVGLMTENTFITNPASQINATQEATVVLYFTDSDGVDLYPEKRTLHYFTSMSAEWMVVEQLIAGPDTDESALSATLPAETSVISVTTADGICYVNLDQAFLSTTFTVQPETAIYSIVNSLCELDGVDAVQILVDGESDLTYLTISLDQVFTADESRIEQDADPVETEIPEEDQ